MSGVKIKKTCKEAKHSLVEATRFRTINKADHNVLSLECANQNNVGKLLHAKIE